MEASELAAYKAWADDLLYDSLSSLSGHELQQQRKMLFGNIISLLHHVYAMDIVWKSNLLGMDHFLQSRNPEVTIGFSALRAQQIMINDWYYQYYCRLSHEDMTELVDFTFIGGGAGRLSRTEILHHIVNHASYHRGHIEGVLYQLSVEPPTTDLPVFLQTRKSAV